ncbi:MAG: MATE family efflux transporter [candidate division Zixibacteria bacterium]|nr:MATE family efflux transporter [candidate division Zixibacteria bacterium]
MNDNKGKNHADYTEGSIFGSILKMGLPSMFGFLSQNIYSLVDTYWVSKLPGEESGVAAITFFATILWMFFSFNNLVGPGSVAIISRRYGEKQYDLAEKAIKETLILKLFIGFLFGIIGYFYVDIMLGFLGAEGAALSEGIAYGRIMFLGMGIMYATYSIYTALRGIANPQMAMILMLASNILNMVLDPLLMFGYWGFPALGIEGAALASVTSYSLTFIVGMFLLYGNYTNVKLHISGKASVAVESMWKIIRIGIPAWLGRLSFSSARLVITPLIAAFGTKVVAAYGVGNQVTHFGIMVLVGIGLGLSSLIGHNVGSGKLERAKKTADQAIWLGVGVMCFFGLVVFVFASQIMGIFFDNPETIGYGVEMLRVFAVGFPFMGAFMMIGEIHLGVGLNSPTMVMDVIHSWVLEVGPILLLTTFLGFDQTAIWWTITFAGTVSSIIFYIYYKRGRWLTVRV